MFQLIGTPQGIERVSVQFKDIPKGFKKYRVKYECMNEILSRRNPIYKWHDSKISMGGKCAVPIKAQASSK